jgi:hypothetical protein
MTRKKEFDEIMEVLTVYQKRIDGLEEEVTGLKNTVEKMKNVLMRKK